MLIARGLRLGLLDPSLREKEKERESEETRDASPFSSLLVFFMRGSGARPS